MNEDRAQITKIEQKDDEIYMEARAGKVHPKGYTAHIKVDAMKDWRPILDELAKDDKPKETGPEDFRAEERLDALFTEAFETNHPAMLDWVQIKMELKKLKARVKELEAGR